jgi:hypothetical protein
MKTNLLSRSLWVLLAATIIITGCRPEIEVVKERPDDIIATKPCKTLYRSIIDMFPEYKNNRDKQKVLFSDTTQKKVVLKRDTEVYITFISEGAGYSNSFGYYLYNKNTQLQNTSELDLKVVFPNVSDKILNQGDMIQLGVGKLPAGTVIGFFLVFQGWDHGTINWDKPVVLSDYNLNSNGQQQHIFFKQKDCGDFVLAFEDKPIGDNSDQDFNDMIFTVSDNRDENETISFETEGLPEL